VEIKTGAVIVATGFEPFDARRKPEYGYGQYPQVITTLDLEERLSQRRTGTTTIDRPGALRRLA